MDRTVIDEVAERIGKTPAETWQLIRSGVLVISYYPGRTSTDPYQFDLTLGAKGNNTQ